VSPAFPQSSVSASCEVDVCPRSVIASDPEINLFWILLRL
jgi:hypothetical protein